MTPEPADPVVDPAFAESLCKALDARALRNLSSTPLAGGAIQDMRALELEVSGGPHAGLQRWVLRRDAQATIAESRSRLEEHLLLEVAHRAGVTVPRPIACGRLPDGSAWSVVERLEGTGYGPKIVKSSSLGGDREALLERLGHELATIHGIDTRSPDLAFLDSDKNATSVHAAAARELDRLCSALDALDVARPILERGIRLARARMVTLSDAPLPPTLLHRDFRTGNLLLDASGLVAVLDWEFADLGDPMSDIGWFCARCWRFSRPDLEAGGLGARSAFYRGYEETAGPIEEDRVRWWEIVAHLRWAVIALQQGARHASGQERSLALALTGRIADTLERDALGMLIEEGVAGPIERDGVPTTSRSNEPDPASQAGTGPDAGLLEAAASELIDALPTASGPLDLTLRMAIRAMQMTQRELLMHPQVERCAQALYTLAGCSDPAVLASAVRAGHYDEGDLDAALLALGIARGAVVDGCDSKRT